MHELVSHKGPVLIHFKYETKGLDAALEQDAKWDLADDSAEFFDCTLQSVFGERKGKANNIPGSQEMLAGWPQMSETLKESCRVLVSLSNLLYTLGEVHCLTVSAAQ